MRVVEDGLEPIGVCSAGEFYFREGQRKTEVFFRDNGGLRSARPVAHFFGEFHRRTATRFVEAEILFHGLED